jgi:uncharacterized protein (DUF1684 family)
MNYCRKLAHLTAGSIVAGLILTPVPALVGGQGITTVDSYERDLLKWRIDREAGLKADDGWLAVAGLYWLEPGSNTFGSDPSNMIVLPAASARPRVGTFEYQNGKTAVRLEPGVTVTLNGAPFAGRASLKADDSGEPDVLGMGDLSLFVIERGDKHAIRLRDKNSAMRRAFTGLRWYPISRNYRITARFVSYPKPKPISIPNILGTVSDSPSPGYATFTLNGREVRLEPILEAPDAEELFFIFKDLTSGTETYPAGRFLYADMPKDGMVVLDFNKAYSPPCAYTPFATCPLPPKQNQLSVKIEAGEMDYGAH